MRSVLFFITCRVCLDQDVQPPLSAHLLGRTIYRDKTERIGAARPLHFPCNRTFRCTSGSIRRPRGLCKRKNKNKEKLASGGHRGRSEKPLQSFPSSAFRLLDRSLDGVRPESVLLLRVALVPPPLPPPPSLHSCCLPSFPPPPLLSLLPLTSRSLSPSVRLSVCQLRRSPSSLSRIQSIFSPA